MMLSIPEFEKATEQVIQDRGFDHFRGLLTFEPAVYGGSTSVDGPETSGLDVYIDGTYVAWIFPGGERYPEKWVSHVTFPSGGEGETSAETPYDIMTTILREWDREFKMNEAKLRRLIRENLSPQDEAKQIILSIWPHLNEENILIDRYSNSHIDIEPMFSVDFEDLLKLRKQFMGDITVEDNHEQGITVSIMNWSL
jgi:hypothetical protein